MTDQEKNRCVALLRVIVDPVVEDFGRQIQEAQRIFGFNQPDETGRRRRGRPARMKRGWEPTKETKGTKELK